MHFETLKDKLDHGVNNSLKIMANAFKMDKSLFANLSTSYRLSNLENS